jgi:hypothetical protein
MKERRRAPRHRCRLRAELRRGGKRFEASLLDVSLSGLSLQTGVALSQGEPVELEIAGEVRVKALAWHAHRLKKPGPPTYKIGMMLAEVGPDYELLVARVAGAQPAPRRARDAQAEPGAVRPEAASPPRRVQPSAGGSSHASPVTGAPGTGRAAAPAATPAPRRGLPPLPTKRPPWWRVRLKETSGARSRVVTLAAVSREAAAAGSLAEAGPGWQVVEVAPTS